MKYSLKELDAMEGHEFEYAVADLLRHNGYRDVSVTQGSGDYGIDILARRKNVKYAIQCKRYKGTVGVKAVQEAGLGTDFYHCDAAAVITNSEFTKQAINLAQTTGVRLWGREFLEELIDNYDDEYDEIDPSIMHESVVRKNGNPQHSTVLKQVQKNNSEQCMKGERKTGSAKDIHVEEKACIKKDAEIKQQKKINNKAVLSLVFGIISWLFIATIIIPIVFSIWSIIDGMAALENKTKHKNMAIIGILLSVGVLALIIFAIGKAL